MKNSEYWRGRFAILEDAAHNQSDQYLSSLEKIYHEAEISVKKEIEAWYGRFAQNNQISLTEARKILNAGQMEEFKWTVEQYVKAGEQADLSPQWIKKMENASARYHVSRLEAVQIQIQQQIELLFSNQLDGIDDLLRKMVSNGYIHGAYEIQKGIGLGWDFAALDQKKLDTMLSKPWTADGRTFRDRCWQNKTELVDAVNKDLIQGMLRGDSPQKAITAIQKQFGTARYKAARLVHTETTYFNAVSKNQMYSDLGVDMIEIVETLDGRTCEICQPMDGKVIPLSQYEPGVTVPPFHPNCRGTTCPHYDDMVGERAARNADSEVYYVPADMTYSEWKCDFLSDSVATPYTHEENKEQYQRYKQVLKELAPQNIEDFLDIKYNDSEKWQTLKYQYRTVNRYDIDGEVQISKILELDSAAWYTKQTAFDPTPFSGKARQDIKKLKLSGNAACMDLDGKIYFSHSRVSLPGTLEACAYNGEYPLVCQRENRRFEVLNLNDGVPRNSDTEAKFLEYVASIKSPGEEFSVTILSEKHICKSCQYVVRQFKEQFPKATVTIVSGKYGYNHSPDGTKTWKYRKRVQVK